MPHRPIQAVIAGRKLHSVPSTTTVQAAAKLMAGARIGAVLVIDDGALKGIFTERDALNRVIAEALDASTTTLASVMTPDPRTTPASKPLGLALHIMHAEGLRHMPVVDKQGRAIGMVSARDALGAEMAAFERDLDKRDSITELLG